MTSPSEKDCGEGREGEQQQALFLSAPAMFMLHLHGILPRNTNSCKLRYIHPLGQDAAGKPVKLKLKEFYSKYVARVGHLNCTLNYMPFCVQSKALEVFEIETEARSWHVLEPIPPPEDTPLPPDSDGGDEISLPEQDDESLADVTESEEEEDQEMPDAGTFDTHDGTADSLDETVVQRTGPDKPGSGSSQKSGDKKRKREGKSASLREATGEKSAAYARLRNVLDHIAAGHSGADPVSDAGAAPAGRPDHAGEAAGQEAEDQAAGQATA